MMLTPAGSLLLVAAFNPLAAIGAQLPDTSVRVAVGFGVDTIGVPNHEIFALWRSYLSSRPSCWQQSPLWAPSEQAQWPVADLLCNYVYQGFTKFTVVHLAPAVGLNSTYLIRTLVAGVSDPEQDVQPLALYRVYATSEQGRWASPAQAWCARRTPACVGPRRRASSRSRAPRA